MRPRRHQPLLIICFFVLAGLGGATLAWPLWLLTELPFDKVVSRSVLLMAAVLLWPLAHLLAFDRDQLGWQWQSAAHFARFWLLGIVLILPPAGIFLWTGFRVPDSHLLLDGGALLRTVFSGLAGGLLAAILEEAIFRGVLLSAFERVLPLTLAILCSSCAYALVHFLRTDAVVSAPDWTSGYAMLAAAFVPYAEPDAWWDAFIGLSTLGVLLCLVRVRTQSLVPCIALHASWIFFLRLYKEGTSRNPESSWAWLAGGYDNFSGLLVAAWLLVLMVAFAWLSRGARVRVWR
jgi:membrane protease YdiL (CAAX protease family)